MSTQFKVGQKVRLNAHFPGCFVGHAGEVTEVRSTSILVLLSDGTRITAYAWELDAEPEPRPEEYTITVKVKIDADFSEIEEKVRKAFSARAQLPKFSVGTLVRVPSGQAGEITDVRLTREGVQYDVTFGRTSPNTKQFPESSLEAASLQKGDKVLIRDSEEIKNKLQNKVVTIDGAFAVGPRPRQIVYYFTNGKHLGEEYIARKLTDAQVRAHERIAARFTDEEWRLILEHGNLFEGVFNEEIIPRLRKYNAVMPGENSPIYKTLKAAALLAWRSAGREHPHPSRDRMKPVGEVSGRMSFTPHTVK